MGLGDAKLLSGLGFIFGLKSIFIILFTASILGLYIQSRNYYWEKALKDCFTFWSVLIIGSVIYFFTLVFKR